MNRHAVGALICVTAIGCASAAGFDGLGAADRALFTACGPALAASACGDGDDATKARCLDARSAAYGRLRSARLRRRWLIANGCSESTVDAPATSVAAVTSPSPSGPTDATATAAVPAAEPAPPTAEPAQPPPPAVAPEEDAPLEPPPASSAFGMPSDSPPPDAREVAGAPAASVPIASVPIASAKLAAAPEAGEQRLRDIIVAHSAEMKNCVDRQLKLIPDLHAEGTLLIEVDAIGAVARVELLGTELAGTPLESCLQVVAARWRFPRSRRAYRIDAPVRVFGTGLGH